MLIVIILKNTDLLLRMDNMRKQNMLKDDKIAELLKDNPNEK